LAGSMKEIRLEKYRPRTLSDVVGQGDIVERLKAYVKSGNLPHLLFAGTPGTEKMTYAVASPVSWTAKRGGPTSARRLAANPRVRRECVLAASPPTGTNGDHAAHRTRQRSGHRSPIRSHARSGELS